MAFTRFHDDPLRIQKQVDESTFSGRYMLNTPGQGIHMPFQGDAQLRLQRWGANITTNIIPLESDFRGLSRPLCRDDPDLNDYEKCPEFKVANEINCKIILINFEQGYSSTKSISLLGSN
jgi:hypothetical protein